MKQQKPTSSMLQITDPKIAKSIIDGAHQRFLHPFVDRESSIKDAAQSLGINMDQLLYWVQKWLDLGILIVSRTQARKGRSIKFYRTTAEKIFIHMSATSSGLTLEMLRNTREHYDRLLTTNLALAMSERDDLGIIISRSSSGDVECKLHSCQKQAPQKTNSPAVLDFFVPNLNMDTEQAAQFTQDLSELVQKYLGGPKGTPHMLHIGLTPNLTNTPE